MHARNITLLQDLLLYLAKSKEQQYPLGNMNGWHYEDGCVVKQKKYVTTGTFRGTEPRSIPKLWSGEGGVWPRMLRTIVTHGMRKPNPPNYCCSCQMTSAGNNLLSGPAGCHRVCMCTHVCALYVCVCVCEDGWVFLVIKTDMSNILRTSYHGKYLYKWYM